jgi:polar amino acid transport system substrate-binding protein
MAIVSPARFALGMLAAVALSLTMLGASPASDAVSPALARIRQQGAVRIGMTGDQPPLSMRSKKGAIIGFDADLARAIASGMSVKLEVVTKPFAELLPALEAGEIDLVISGMTITPERNMRAAFVGPYLMSGKSILTRSKTLTGVKDVDGLNNGKFTLAALAGSTSEIFVKELAPKAKLKTTASLEEATKLVRSGKADALVADFPYCVFAGARDKSGEMNALAEPLTFEPLGIAVPPGDALFLNLIENSLTTLEGTGALDAFKQRWLGDDDWLAEIE